MQARTAKNFSFKEAALGNIVLGKLPPFKVANGAVQLLMHTFNPFGEKGSDIWKFSALRKQLASGLGQLQILTQFFHMPVAKSALLS